jgi:hypothetical protein
VHKSQRLAQIHTCVSEAGHSLPTVRRNGPAQFIAHCIRGVVTRNKNAGEKNMRMFQLNRIGSVVK